MRKEQLFSGVSFNTISTPVAASRARYGLHVRWYVPLISSDSIWTQLRNSSMAVSVAYTLYRLHEQQSVWHRPYIIDIRPRLSLCPSFNDLPAFFCSLRRQRANLKVLPVFQFPDAEFVQFPFLLSTIDQFPRFSLGQHRLSVFTLNFFRRWLSTISRCFSYFQPVNFGYAELPSKSAFYWETSYSSSLFLITSACLCFFRGHYHRWPSVSFKQYVMIRFPSYDEGFGYYCCFQYCN